MLNTKLTCQHFRENAMFQSRALYSVRLLFPTFHVDVQSPSCSSQPGTIASLSLLPQHGIRLSLSLLYEYNGVLVGTAVLHCTSLFAISYGSLTLLICQKKRNFESCVSRTCGTAGVEKLIIKCSSTWLLSCPEAGYLHVSFIPQKVCPVPGS